MLVMKCPSCLPPKQKTNKIESCFTLRDKVIDFLKIKHYIDATELLFLGYAKILKTLPQRR
jgi:hypothetical protein